jgi:cytosine/adenosine deaminase-related metal-dependent hydrolase
MVRLTLPVLLGIAIGAGAISPDPTLLSQSQPTASRCDSSPLVVTNTSVWTADGMLANRDVVFRDGRVTAIAAAGGEKHVGLRRIDGSGHTLLPGLIDAHLHFTISGGLPSKDGPRKDLEDLTGRQLVRSGVTSGRLHLATIDEAVRLKQRAADPCEPVPRLQVGGPGLSGALDKDFNNFQGVKSSEDAAAKIERLRAAGIDWLAIHDADRFAPGLLETVAVTARKAGLRLMASGGTPQEITAALSIRPDTLDYFDRTAEPRYSAAILDLIKVHASLVIVPTPGVPYRTLQYLQSPALLDRPESFELLDATDRAFVLGNARKDLAGAEGARAQRIGLSLSGKIRQLRELGLPMALGSDAGSPLQFPSGAIWWELEAWRSTGASHREALRAATIGGARVLGGEIGKLEIGSRADFVLYRGNVEDGRFELSRVMTVGKGGVLFVNDGKWLGLSSQ